MLVLLGASVSRGDSQLLVVGEGAVEWWGKEGSMGEPGGEEDDDDDDDDEGLP